MASRVGVLDNPRFQVAPLGSTGGSIVSVRRVKIPVTNPTTFTGIRSGPVTGQTFLYFDLADNECFVDLKKMLLCLDLTVFGPNESATVSTGRGQGQDLPLCFDQSTQALIATLSIGSSQGLKFEEIQCYNLLANVQSFHLENRQHKEMSLLDRSAFEKTWDKDKGMHKLTDGTLTFIGTHQIEIGRRQRIQLRFHHSSFLNSVDMLPLFLLRNGIRMQINFESAAKVFHMPVASHPANDIVIPCATQTGVPVTMLPTWFVSPGDYYMDASGNKQATYATTLPASVNTYDGLIYQWGNTLANNATNFLHTNATGSFTEVPNYNILCLSRGQVQRMIATIPGFDLPFPNAAILTFHSFAVPISIYESGTVVWNGFIHVVPAGIGTQSYDLTYQTSVTVNNVDQTASTTYASSASAGSNWHWTQVTATAGSAFVSENDQESKENQAKNPNIQDQSPDDTYHAQLGTLQLYKFDNTTALSRPLYAGFKMYSYNDQQQIPYINFGAASGTPATNQGNLATAVNALLNRSAKLVIHAKDAVRIQRTFSSITTVTAQTVLERGKNTLSGALSLWSLYSQYRTVRYTIQQAEMLTELVKPSAQDFLRYQTNFSSPAGIAYKFNRWLYRKNTYTPSTGLTQINLPVSVRSLTKLLVIIQDTAMDTEPSSLINALMLSNLSSGLRRNCTRAEIVVGGQLWPVYPLYFKADSTNYGNDHIPETEKFYGQIGSNSLQPSFHTSELRHVRNYLAGGWLGSTSASIGASLNSLNSTYGARATYVDSSKFFMAFSLAKDDLMPFTTGIDSSQSGAINLNLYFQDTIKDSAAGFNANQQFDVHIFAGCDAVATLQLAANLVRY